MTFRSTLKNPDKMQLSQLILRHLIIESETCLPDKKTKERKGDIVLVYRTLYICMTEKMWTERNWKLQTAAETERDVA